jgi:aspartate/methionine/tyrosine aminotransferase
MSLSLILRRESLKISGMRYTRVAAKIKASNAYIAIDYLYNTLIYSTIPPPSVLKIPK